MATNVTVLWEGQSKVLHVTTIQEAKTLLGITYDVNASLNGLRMPLYTIIPSFSFIKFSPRKPKMKKTLTKTTRKTTTGKSKKSTIKTAKTAKKGKGKKGGCK